MAMNSESEVVYTYPLSHYTFHLKSTVVKGRSPHDRVATLKHSYKYDGMRTTVEGVLLVHKHNHPHILLLKVKGSFYMLPGGSLKPGENEIEGLKRKLNSKLASSVPEYVPDWQIGQCLGIWWRPNFEVVMYPYCPPHITKPKECRKLFLVHLPERAYFVVPKNSDLIAVPLFELYDNAEKYGSVMSAIPSHLSRFSLRMMTD